MKQEDVNTIVDRCINDFNFDCVLKFFGVFGDTESPKFWLNIPTHRINKDITPGNVVETT